MSANILQSLNDVTWISVTQEMKDRVTRITEDKKSALTILQKALLSFNRKHNLISSRAESHVYDHHIRHCLALGCMSFPPGVDIVDWGSGGGLPAIPLALAFPEVQVTAVDKVRKKMLAVEAIGRKLGLTNLKTFHGLADSYYEPAAISVSRATASLSTLWDWHGQVSGANQCEGRDSSGSWSAGMICMKGGDLQQEIAELIELNKNLSVSGIALQGLYPEQYYKEKVLLHVKSAD